MKKILDILSKAKKWFYIFIPIYFLILIVFDFIYYKRIKSEIFITYIEIFILSCFIYISVFLVLMFQRKNKFCTSKVYNLFVLIAIAVFFIGSAIFAITYFTEEFLMMSFIGPVALLSALNSIDLEEDDKKDK